MTKITFDKLSGLDVLPEYDGSDNWYVFCVALEATPIEFLYEIYHLLRGMSLTSQSDFLLSRCGLTSLDGCMNCYMSYCKNSLNERQGVALLLSCHSCLYLSEQPDSGVTYGRLLNLNVYFTSRSSPGGIRSSFTNPSSISAEFWRFVL